MEMTDLADKDEDGTGVKVPAPSQADEFIFDTIFLFGEVETNVGDQRQHVEGHLVSSITERGNLEEHIL
jgi:hypothetical protein